MCYRRHNLYVQFKKNVSKQVESLNKYDIIIIVEHYFVVYEKCNYMQRFKQVQR